MQRPDIDAPRWSSTVYNASALAPGHWFVGPYGIVDQTDNDKAYVGPGIYNSLSGELVWNGGSELDHFNVYGLKVSKFRGEDVLTFLQPQESHGVIMDSTFQSCFLAALAAFFSSFRRLCADFVVIAV